MPLLPCDFEQGGIEDGLTKTLVNGGGAPSGNGVYAIAQLAVFLLTSDEASYCGQNLPDWPTWRPFAVWSDTHAF